MIFHICLFSASFFNIIGISLGEDLPTECGKTRYDGKKANRISNDTGARIGEYPWQARIGAKHENETLFYCGGSLITRQHVLTSTRCGRVGTLVRIGDNILDSDVDCDECVCAPPHQDVRINRYISSDECNLKGPSNLLMILELNEPITFNEFVQPACIPERSMLRKLIKSNTTMKASGWGILYSGWGGVKRGNSSVLAHTHLTTVEDEKCNNSYASPMDDSRFCVQHEENVEDPCIADSGGPLIKYMKKSRGKRAYLAGIATHDLVMCEIQSHVPVMYSDVSFFKPWIKEQVADSFSELQRKG